MMRDQRAHQLEFIRFEIPNQSITESAAVLRTGEVVAVEVEFFKVCQGGGAARDAPCKLIRSQVEHDERRQPAHVRVHLAPDGVVAQVQALQLPQSPEPAHRQRPSQLVVALLWVCVGAGVPARE